MASWYDAFSGRSNHRIRLDVSLNKQEVSNNRSLVNWALYLERLDAYGAWRLDTDSTGNCYVNGDRVGVSPFGYDTRNTSRITLGSGTKWVAHNADGTKTFLMSANVSAQGPLGEAVITSKSVYLPTIPRATEPGFPSAFDAGEALTISLLRASSTFTHDVTYTFGGQSGTIATGAGVSASWTPPLGLLSEIPNATSGSGTITVVTKQGSTVIGSKSKNFTLRAPASVTPTISAINVSDDNPDVASAIGAYVQGQSRLRATVTAAGAYGSTIKARTFSVDGQSAGSGGAVALPNAGTRAVAAAVTDSRGRSGTATGSIDVLAYDDPQVAEFAVTRADAAGVPDTNGTHLLMTLNASVSSLLVSAVEKNALTVTVFTRPRGTAAWTARNVITPGLAYDDSVLVAGGGIFATTTSWDVRVDVADELQTAGDFYAVPTAGAIVDATEDKQAFGKMVETSGPATQIQGPARVYGAVETDGPVTVTGDVTATGDAIVDRVRIVGTGDASPSSTGHGFQIGPTDGVNLIADGNEIMARTNGAASDLNINYNGGDVSLGDAASETRIRGRLNAAHLPWAMASGVALSGGNDGSAAPVFWDAGVTVTLPAGRFTHPPHVQVSPERSGQVLTANVISRTTSSFVVRTIRFGASVSSGTNVHWTATQMTPNGASG